MDNLRWVSPRKKEEMEKEGYRIIKKYPDHLTEKHINRHTELILMEKADVVEKPKVKREKISKPKVVEQPILEEKVEEIV